MTGYGISQYQSQDMSLSITIKSYNSKYLDLFYYVPSVLANLEENFGELLREVIVRGKIEVKVQYSSLKEDTGSGVHELSIKKTIHALNQIKSMIGDTEPIKAIEIAKLTENLFKTENGISELEKDIILKTFINARHEFVESRTREGQKIYLDLKKLLDILHEKRLWLVSVMPKMQLTLKKSLNDRFIEVLGDQVEESRVLQEIGLTLVRYSVHEELQRLEMHIDKAYELVQAEQAIAKKFDFLCQELHREVNTLGSKSIDAEISHVIIDMKEVIDSMREQIRNIE